MHSESQHEARDMAEIGRALREPVSASAGFDERVMRSVRAMPPHGRTEWWVRLTTPRRRTITLAPLTWGALAAGLLLVAALGVVRTFMDLETGVGTDAPSQVAAAPAPNVSAVKPVQFVLVAPAANKVAVVGDFNGWDANHAQYQAQHRGGGVWSVTAPVPVGHHRYSFVVDDSLWVTDPSAPRVADNDFGVASSAMIVEEYR
jgi:hypothetical protein